MSEVLKAIETQYKGCLFRSRLEARWAVFFDAMELDWVYEHEGYELGKYGRYLPDFYFPSSDLYIEIKPPRPSQRELLKPIALAKFFQKRVIVLAGSIPNEGRYIPTEIDGENGILITWDKLLECRKCNGIWLSSKDDCSCSALVCDCSDDRCRYPFEGERLLFSYMTASSARFETKDRCKI